MTNKQAYAGLLERLRGLIPISSLTGHSDFGLVNPDGPEAAEAISSLLKALEPFADVFEKRWAEYPSAPDIAPISLGFAMHAEARSGDLQLSDFRRAYAALNSDAPLSIGEGL